MASGSCRRASHRLVRALVVIGVVLFTCTGRWAAAAIIPNLDAPIPASISADLLLPLPANPLNVRTFGEHQLAGPGGLLRVDSGLIPSPYLHASVDISDNFFGRVSATLFYELVIVEPTGISNLPIPVFAAVFGDLHGSALPPPLGNGGFALKATWSVENVSSGAVVAEGGIVTPGLSGAYFDSFTDSVSLSLTANQRFRVKLVADVGIRSGKTNGGIGSAHAFVDPVFSFGPGVGGQALPPESRALPQVELFG